MSTTPELPGQMDVLDLLEVRPLPAVIVYSAARPQPERPRDTQCARCHRAGLMLYSGRFTRAYSWELCQRCTEAQDPDTREALRAAEREATAAYEAEHGHSPVGAPCTCTPKETP